MHDGNWKAFILMLLLLRTASCAGFKSLSTCRDSYCTPTLLESAAGHA
jgi:hypothetical protein